MYSSDLDAFRSDGVIQTRSVTFSGVVGAGMVQSKTTSTFTLANLDFYQVLFDNSFYHSGKYRDMSLEGGTFVLENTSPVELSVWFEPKINGNTLTITAKLFNPADYDVTLQTTTLNFRFVPYDSTLL
jgi:hypothetical protein